MHGQITTWMPVGGRREARGEGRREGQERAGADGFPACTVLTVDQGAAAIIAAIAGVGGTAIGALIAARAARQQVHQQAVTEHRHWQRQARNDAYATFLTRLDAMGRASDHATVEVDHQPQADETDAAVEACLTATREMRAAVALVAVAGPHQMADLARQSQDAAEVISDNIVYYTGVLIEDPGRGREFWDLMRELREELNALEGEFIRGAADALSPPSTA